MIPLDIRVVPYISWDSMGHLLLNHNFISPMNNGCMGGTKKLHVTSLTVPSVGGLRDGIRMGMIEIC